MKIHNYNLDQIKSLIVDRKDLLVVTSPSCTSENAISKQLGSINDSNWRISLTGVNANSSIDSLCHDIIRQALPNKAEDTAPIVAQVHQYLEHSARNGIVACNHH